MVSIRPGKIWQPLFVLQHSRSIAKIQATGLWPVECRKFLDNNISTIHKLVTTEFAVKRTFGRRPPRLGRIFATGPLYFVTFCTHERQRFLARDEVHTAFVLFAKRAECNFNVAVGRYVIMPDHIHLFVRGGCNFRLGAWIGALKQVLAKAGMLSRAKGQVWQEGFFDHVLRTNESYSQKWNYVRENPVRAGLIKSAADWPYQGEIVYIDRA